MLKAIKSFTRTDLKGLLKGQVLELLWRQTTCCTFSDEHVRVRQESIKLAQQQMYFLHRLALIDRLLYIYLFIIQQNVLCFTDWHFIQEKGRLDIFHATTQYVRLFYYL